MRNVRYLYFYFYNKSYEMRYIYVYEAENIRKKKTRLHKSSIKNLKTIIRKLIFRNFFFILL